MNPRPFISQRVLVIDVETTGFDPTRHACVDLGAVLLNERLETVATFSSLVAPWSGAAIEPQAMQINRISAADLAKAPSVLGVVQRFRAEVLNGRPLPLLAGWNVWFDVSFLRQLFARAGVEWPFRHRFLDIQSVFAFHRGLAPVSQEAAISEAFQEKQEHRALADATHTARLLRLLTQQHL